MSSSEDLGGVPRSGSDSSMKGAADNVLPDGSRLPSTMNESGVYYYLKQEIAAAREAVSNLDKACSKAISFRERSSATLEEASRALSRIQQAVEKEKAAALVAVACELKIATRTALTLVEVYGSKSKIGKMLTLGMRKQIHTKFDVVADRLKQILPSGTAATDAGTTLTTQNSGKNPKPLVGKPAPKTDRPLGSRSIGGYSFPASLGISSPSSLGTVIREDKHGKHQRIVSLCYVPLSALTFECVCLWWSAGQLLEFFSESSDSTTAFEVKDPNLTVTCLAVDHEGNVWSGHIKGLVRVKKKQAWELVIENQGPATPVRVISFDSKGRAWVADDQGQVRVLKYDSNETKLEVVSSLVHLSSLELKQPDKPGAGAAGKPAAKALWYKTATASTPPKRAQGPARCIFVSNSRAWVGGGRTDGWLALWSADTYTQIDIWESPTFGVCNAISPIRWGSSPPSRSSSMAKSVSASSLTERKDFDPGNFATNSLSTAFGTQATWRLLTGHENGQVLLWHPDSDRLLPLLRIGEPTSPIRGITVFKDYNLVVIGHASGELALTAQQGMEPPGSENLSSANFGMFKPRRVMIRAHKGNLAMMVGYENTCVSASHLGTIKLWQAKELVSEAEHQGLVTDRNMDRMASDKIGPTGRRQFSLNSNGRTESDTQIGPVKRSSSECGSPTAPIMLSNSHDETASMSESPSGALTATSSQAPNPNSFGFSGGCQMIESSELDLQKLIGAGAYGK
eukprot:gene25957-11641_t